jgi:hypothetical protein
MPKLSKNSFIFALGDVDLIIKLSKKGRPVTGKGSALPRNLLARAQYWRMPSPIMEKSTSQITTPRQFLSYSIAYTRNWTKFHANFHINCCMTLLFWWTSTIALGRSSFSWILGLISGRMWASVERMGTRDGCLLLGCLEKRIFYRVSQEACEAYLD